MKLYKLYAFLIFVGLAFPGGAAGQTTTPAGKIEAAAPEFEQKALNLLASLAGESQQFTLPENRIRAQVVIAELMWSRDEKAAREIFRNAYGELQNMFVKIALPDGIEMNSTERAQHYSRRYKLADLRKELILALAVRDPRAALAALAGLKTKTLEEYDPLGEDELELKITTAIAKNDPDKSYAVAREQLDENGVNYQFTEMLKNLYQRNPSIAASLGRDVLAKIKSLKIRVPPATGSRPPNPKTEIDFSQVSWFLHSASEINRRAAGGKSKKTVPLLSADEMRELTEIIANAYLAETDPAPYQISQAMREITRYSPALAQRIRQKLGADGSRQLDKVSESDSFYTDSREKSAEELAKIADVSAPEVRDSRYSTAAFKAIEADEPEKALAIAARIKDRKNFQYLFEQIQIALPLAKARRGEMDEVRRMIATLKTNEEKVGALTELAATLAAKGEFEPAKTLLEESLQMVPALVRDQKTLVANVKIAGVYALADPERAFTIIENGIGQMNEYISSGIKLEEFFGNSQVEAEELFFLSMNKPVLTFIPNSFALAKNLARADFERTLALADKFERPEIRLYVRLLVARALLDPKAAQTEKKMREQLVSDEDMN